MASLKDTVIIGDLSVTDNISLGNILKITPITGGTGTVGADKGSGVSPRYIPSTWSFNTDVQLIHGSIICIQIPVAGISYGVFLSMDNGVTYKPVAYGNGSRLTTHFGVGVNIILYYDAEGAATIYALGGADATSSITGGVWRTLTMYDSNTTYSAMGTAEVTAGTASSSRVMQARYLSAGLKAAIIKGTNAVPGQFTVYGTVVDTLGATTNQNGKFLTVSSGTPTWENIPTELPAVTSTDNGKFLRVVNGAWAAETIPNASGVSF